MKTSNIILVSLLSGLLLIILTAALDVRLNGEYRANTKNTNFSSTEFQSINHIVINDISVTIEQNNKNKVTLIYGGSDNVTDEVINEEAIGLPKPELKITGDTLFIDRDILRGQENYKHVTISISDYLQSVTSRNSHMSIKGGLAKYIHVEGKSLNMQNVEVEPRLNNISINAKNCDIQFSPVVDTLDVKLVGTQLNLLSTVDLLSGEMNNNSRLISQDNISRLYISKDKSSNILIH